MSIVATAARSRRVNVLAMNERAASCALARPFGDEKLMSKRRRKLRRAAGFSGEVFRMSLEAKSTRSKEVISRVFPWSTISKFAWVSPRTGLPSRSTTVTGTSTRWTFTVSLSFDGCPRAAVALATSARAMRLRRRIRVFSLWEEECARSAGDSVNSLFQCYSVLLQHPVPQNPRYLRDNLVRVLPEVILDAEDDLNREVVVEDPRGQHDGGDRREAVLQLRSQLVFHAVLLHEGLEALGHVRVELADVTAVELDDVDVDERHVVAVGLHRLARGAPHLLEVLRKRPRGQGAVERK